MTAWAVALLHDATKPIGYSETRTFGATVVMACVETHTYIGKTGQQVPGGLRGITLYAGNGPPSTPSPTTIAEGIDVSAFQPHVDWSAVASGGHAFAFMKASEGITITDTCHAAHYAGAGAAGLLRGPYHFYRASSEPRAQVRRFVELAGACGDWELPFVLDAEWQSSTAPTGALSAGAFADALVDAVDELTTQTERKPLLYTAPGFWTLLPQAQRRELAATCALWIAHYTHGAPSLPAEWARWTFWQYSESALIPGVAARVDSNRFAGSVDALRAFADQAPDTDPSPVAA
jgi:GH25 family lysozyme M1 (1,4-beta-N-acetylmuramidase)